jgi:hypothetical protein
MELLQPAVETPCSQEHCLTSKRIFVDISVFHDDLEIAGGVGNEADIVQRISIDKQQIRECTLFHDAEFAGVRIPLAGQRQQFGVC